MGTVIQFANTIFKPLISLGAAPMMFIVLSILAILMRVKVSKAIEGGLKLAIALTAIGQIISLLTTNFSEALKAFVESTGINLSITDLGWAPVATITWGSMYTLFFLFVLVIVNAVMLVLNKTNTLDVDIFDIWHPAFCGILLMFYSKNLFIATVFVVFLGILKIINSDLMKPTFNDLLNMPDSNPTTTTHLNYMMNPIIMVFDKLIDKFLPFLDKYDFDAAQLNNKIGFWGSKFAIGAYLGIFVGVLGHQSMIKIFTLAFIGASCLELFSIIGSWFIAAVEPLSQGITNFLSKRLSGRKFNIGIDWPFVAGRAEIWAVANILAPILLVVSLFLPGNKILPLGGIIAMGITPALLIVTRGKMIRMIIIGILEIPIFLWAGTVMAPCVTDLAKQVGAFPHGLAASTLISHSTCEGPVEKFLSILIGKFFGTGDITFGLYAVFGLAVYLLLFIWYAKQMKKRNMEYEKAKM
ncbi:MAG: PTS galactitol transporter subunit IIC [Clostridium sp.]|jgi:PTS system galactitol-specific IIC component|uniref:PTS galactitol transporter subunit IIC n=1 Tax=Clostridium sp. TaxID=1506 RepID=UPI0025BD6B72|nr:PTS galactitol transporter subunit IIC [Clostridium sp.]MCH3964963.1 PTS galactitol transporter subunit IIC [Clostridium sp.]MCI1716543.1 PTS galactitol transporter subunit IIC [Clostridium sp.]MCI1800975.1 PTS galactitol transporter subunit IIC [Clostridium sp.]MCI1814720.1 PTS galactitol transporter subunit IIC [Clostridium sp.]MCI1871722.1 PTS galactitol transporter subunit IIC [Clostridium sp.]